MSFLRHRQRSISAVTRGRWIIPSRRTCVTQFSDAPEVTASSTGLMTIACRTSPAPQLSMSDTGLCAIDCAGGYQPGATADYATGIISIACPLLSAPQSTVNDSTGVIAISDVSE